MVEKNKATWKDRVIGVLIYTNPGHASLTADISRDLKEDSHVLGHIEELCGCHPRLGGSMMFSSGHKETGVE